MAKFEVNIQGDFDDFKNYINQKVIQGSVTASLEEESYGIVGTTRYWVGAYERFSYTGGNRLSMNITLIGDGYQLKLIATSTGGSQAMFFKINTWGEEAFLDTLREAVKTYHLKRRSYDG